MTKRVIDRVQPGSIILFHNAGLNTNEALPTIIEQLLQDGYEIVPVSDMILSGDTYLDHNGKQFPSNAN